MNVKSMEESGHVTVFKVLSEGTEEDQEQPL
jgi:hypothetical protein